MDAQLAVARNFPWCEAYDESSFTGQLHEHGLWAWHEYWLLEKALYDLSKLQQPSRELTWQIFRIFSHTFLLFGCHTDPNDGFEIRQLSAEQVHDLRERFQLVFEGFFEGLMPAQDVFNESNPLLVTAGS